MATPITITGTLINLSGSPIQNATVNFNLQNYGGQLPTVAGSGEVVSLTASTLTNASGVFSITLFGGDVISPANTYYQVIFKDNTGINPISNLYNFVGVGPLDLNTFPPITSVALSPILSPVVTNPTGPQTVSVFALQVPILALGTLFDTGLSRDSAGVIDVGNGTQGDFSGTLRASNYFGNNYVAFNSNTALYSAQPNPVLYATSASGVGFPFTEAGNAILASRPTGATRDILFGTGNPTTLQWAIKRTGSLTAIAGNAVTWVPASDLSAVPDTGISRGAAGQVNVGNGTPGDFSGAVKATTLIATTSNVTTSNATIVNVTGQYQVSGVQISAANLSNGTTGTAGTQVVLATAPTLNGLTVSAGTLDASAAAHTLPFLKGLTASKPATATVGEIYFATDASAGTNLYFATATNTWTQMSSVGIGSPAGTNKQIQYNNAGTMAGTPQLTFDNVAGNTTLQATTAATVSTNPTAPIFAVGTNYWNGAASASDLWSFQDVLGAVGTNPTTTLQISHAGSTGASAVNVPILSLGTGSTDTGISRGAAGQVNFGNGTQGDSSANLAFNRIVAYDAITPVDRGVAYEIASVHVTNQGAVIANTNLLTAPVTGTYRLTVYTQVNTQQAGTPNNVGAVITYSNGTAQTFTAATVDIGGSVAGSNAANSQYIFVVSGTAIVYHTSATGSFTTGKYQLDIELERVS